MWLFLYFHSSWPLLGTVSKQPLHLNGQTVQQPCSQSCIQLTLCVCTAHLALAGVAVRCAVATQNSLPSRGTQVIRLDLHARCVDNPRTLQGRVEAFTTLPWPSKIFMTPMNTKLSSHRAHGCEKLEIFIQFWNFHFPVKAKACPSGHVASWGDVWKHNTYHSAHIMCPFTSFGLFFLGLKCVTRRVSS